MSGTFVSPQSINPVPSPNFDDKLARFKHSTRTRNARRRRPRPSSSAETSTSFRPNEDLYNAGSWRFDAVLQPETRESYRQLLAQLPRLPCWLVLHAVGHFAAVGRELGDDLFVQPDVH